MKVLRIRIHCNNIKTQETEELDTAYLIQMEAEDPLFQEIENNGINPNLLIEVATELGIAFENLSQYEYAAVNKNNAISQLYFLPKTVPEEIKKDLICKYLTNNEEHLDDPEINGYVNNKLYTPGDVEENEEENGEDEDDFLYCYRLNHFSDLNKVPVTQGSIIKDDDNRNYLISENVLHDYLEVTDFPENEYLVLDDVMKMLV